MCSIVAAGGAEDYIGDFLKIVQSWVARKPAHELKSKQIIVSAGPYRSYDVKHSFNPETRVMTLDFYSITRRHGFDPADVEAIIALL